MELTPIIAALIAGGGGGALISAIQNFFFEKRRLKKQFIEEQLRKLYGPVYYKVLVNEKLFEIARSHNKATDTAYFSEEKNWSRDQSTQEHLTKISKDSIEIQNSYIDEVKANNEEIKLILDANYSYVDPEDTEHFVKFLQDYHRLHKEYQGKLRTDLHVYFELEKTIGEISWMDVKFANCIKEKFRSKQETLRALAYCDPASLI